MNDIDNARGKHTWQDFWRLKKTVKADVAGGVSAAEEPPGRATYSHLTSFAIYSYDQQHPRALITFLTKRVVVALRTLGEGRSSRHNA